MRSSNRPAGRTRPIDPGPTQHNCNPGAARQGHAVVDRVRRSRRFRYGRSPACLPADDRAGLRWRARVRFYCRPQLQPLLPRGLRTGVLSPQTRQAWRQGHLDHSTGRRRDRTGSGHDAQGHRSLRRVSVQGKCQACHPVDEGKCSPRLLEWIDRPAWLQARRSRKARTKIKKKLDIDPVEAETVRLIFKLYLHGDGKSGALGVKEIVKWLNARGLSHANGQDFGVGSLHKLLTNTVYIGRWKFNQTSSKTRRRSPTKRSSKSRCRRLSNPDVFERVQRQLHARSPKVVAPRVTTGPILLTGLAVCASCGGGMMLRTGTSKSGRVYRYYTCSNCATKGKTVCKGRSIPMDKLDPLVTDHLMERLVQAGTSGRDLVFICIAPRRESREP